MRNDDELNFVNCCDILVTCDSDSHNVTYLSHTCHTLVTLLSHVTCHMPVTGHNAVPDAVIYLVLFVHCSKYI